MVSGLRQGLGAQGLASFERSFGLQAEVFFLRVFGSKDGGLEATATALLKPERVEIRVLHYES